MNRFAILLCISLVCGCSSIGHMQDAMQNAISGKPVSTETSGFDGAKMVNMREVALDSHEKELAFLPYALGARWSSATADKVTLRFFISNEAMLTRAERRVFSPSTSLGVVAQSTYEPANGIAQIDLLVNGRMSSIKRALPDFSKGQQMDLASMPKPGEFTIPLDTLKKLLSAPGAKMRIMSMAGDLSRDISFERDETEMGRKTARPVLIEFLEAVKQVAPQASGQTPHVLDATKGRGTFMTERQQRK